MPVEHMEFRVGEFKLLLSICRFFGRELTAGICSSYGTLNRLSRLGVGLEYNIYFDCIYYFCAKSSISNILKSKPGGIDSVRTLPFCIPSSYYRSVVSCVPQKTKDDTPVEKCNIEVKVTPMITTRLF